MPNTQNSKISKVQEIQYKKSENGLKARDDCLEYCGMNDTKSSDIPKIHNMINK